MRQHVVVLGAGYSGLVAAKLVARQPDTDVTLVNERDRFVERVRNHQLASGQRLREHPLPALVAGTGITLVVDRATRIDPENRRVTLANAVDELTYDLLIYALGSRADVDSVRGVSEHAYALASFEEAGRLRGDLRPGSTIAVAGGGLTGIETAAELAEAIPDAKVRLVTSGTFGGALSEAGRRHLDDVFHRLGIEVRDRSRITEVRADGLLLDNGEHVAAEFVVWAAGFRVPALATEAGFAVDECGRILVDETLRSVSHPDVYAIGDAAAARRPDGQKLRMACATGAPVAYHAVNAIAARRKGRTPKPLGFGYSSQCISLGRHEALVQFVHADDSPRERILTGRRAALYKEFFVRSAAYAQRRPGLAAIAAIASRT